MISAQGEKHINRWPKTFFCQSLVNICLLLVTVYILWLQIWIWLLFVYCLYVLHLCCIDMPRSKVHKYAYVKNHHRDVHMYAQYTVVIIYQSSMSWSSGWQIYCGIGACCYILKNRYYKLNNNMFLPNGK